MPEPEAVPPDPDTTAAELALGLLDGAEREAAIGRMAREPAFAAAVERWQARFAALFATWPGVAAPAAVAARIEASLDAAAPGARAANDNRAGTGGGAGWRRLAIAASIAACLLLAVTTLLMLRPAPPPVRVPVRVVVPVAAPAPLLAALQPRDGAPVAAAYDPAAGTVRIAGVVAAPAGRVAELWVIRGHEAPRSLGLLPAAGPARIAVAPALRPVVGPGAVLAVSIEPAGGSPTGLPTGAVVASGTLHG